jgi:hypothetical protein
MSVETLNQGTAWVQKQFYSYKNIVRRFARSAAYIQPAIFVRTVVPINLGYRTKLSAYRTFEKGQKFQKNNKAFYA